MSIGLGMGRPKSKLPEPSTNMKTTGKQDYMSEALHVKKERCHGNGIRTYKTGCIPAAISDVC